MKHGDKVRIVCGPHVYNEGVVVGVWNDGKEVSVEFVTQETIPVEYCELVTTHPSHGGGK